MGEDFDIDNPSAQKAMRGAEEEGRVRVSCHDEDGRKGGGGRRTSEGAPVENCPAEIVDGIDPRAMLQQPTKRPHLWPREHKHDE